MSTQKISDIPSIRELFRQAESVSAVMSLLRWVPCLGRLLGLGGDKLDDLHAKASGIQVGLSDLVDTLDRFHAHFSDSGWIFYETMNVPVAKRAVELADSGDADGAQQILVDHYNDEVITFQLLGLGGLACGRDRRRLLSLARQDYVTGRYHACIPVILAQMDGMVNDLQERGFFAESSDLTAKDSLAGHSEGLTKLAGFFRKGRNRTRDEELSIPYRNGIMHGADLGYDNKEVAAKCWAALFATADWARLVEQGHREGKPQEPTPSFTDAMRRVADTQELKRAIEAWRPREIRVGVDVPASGGVDDYEEGSPERAVVEFLTLWQARNYGKMAQLMDSSWGERRRLAGTMRDLHDDRVLKGFDLVSIDDTAAAITVVTVRLDIESAIPEDPDKPIRVVWETEDGAPTVRGRGAGRWYLINGWQPRQSPVWVAKAPLYARGFNRRCNRMSASIAPSRSTPFGRIWTSIPSNLATAASESGVAATDTCWWRRRRLLSTARPHGSRMVDR